MGCGAERLNMSFGRIKIDAADRFFSWFIRERDEWKCVRCGRQHRRKSQGLDNSHYFSRSNEGTRFDPDDCDSLCSFSCHDKWEKEDREEYKAFKIKQLGQARFDALYVKAHTVHKKDRKMALIVAKVILEDLLKSKGLTLKECGYK